MQDFCTSLQGLGPIEPCESKLVAFGTLGLPESRKLYFLVRARVLPKLSPNEPGHHMSVDFSDFFRPR
jgi:hypothetical protein